MRARGSCLILTCLALLALPGLVAAEETDSGWQSGSVAVHGSGFGHGVGMSQYGAHSMSVKGYSSDEIIEHYYTDVRTEARDVGAQGTRALRVGLTANADEWSFTNDSSSARDLHVWLEGGSDGDIAYVEPGESLHVTQDGTDCEVSIGPGEAMGLAPDVEEAACADLAVRWPVDRGDPATFVEMPREEAHDLTLARGWINFVQRDDETVHTRLQIHMEDYLYGLAEMPASWGPAALQAQAVTGRTFALNRASQLNPQANPRGGSCSCDLLTTVSDQHYTGWAKEDASPSWVTAVDATNNATRTHGRVITHEGSLINAFYSSSSPGTTEDPRDIWTADVPYLEPVDDGYAHDADAGNPRSSWTEEFDYEDFSQRLGFDAVLEVELVEHLRSGNPGVYRVEGERDGETVTEELHTYRDLRGDLGLPSHGIWEIELELPHLFSDVPRDHPFHDEIAWLVDEGVAQGFDDGTFRPVTGVSRQAAAAFLYRLAGEPEGSHETDFDDVDEDHPFRDEIAWADANGIVGGYADGTFRPGRVVTRQAMAAFLANYEFGGDVPDGLSNDFEDVDEHHPFHDEISWLADEGLAGGYGDGTFRPRGDVARQAAAAFLHRYAGE